jgi:release factor glutamine methyltransferase
MHMSHHMTLGALLAVGVAQLRAAAHADAASAVLDAELLLAQACKSTRSMLLAQLEKLASESLAREYRELLTRRAAGEPLSYILGRREFWSLDLQVSPAVLVPRPETELLVERALALLGSGPARVADLGTGSGAIALALASERPQWSIVASDESLTALAVAGANARRLGLERIEWRSGSWFAALAAESFDLLLSNPPYIAADDPVLRSGPLAYEPRAALSPGADAMASLRHLARGAASHVRAGGWLLLEHGAQQGAQVRDELVAAGFGYVRSHRDLAGLERVTEGQHGQI